MIKSRFNSIEEYVCNLKKCALDSDLYIIKNTDCSFAYTSDQIIQTYGFSSATDMIGKNVYDIKSSVAEISPQLYTRDQRLISEGKSITMVVYFRAKPLSGFFIQEGSPIFSSKNKLIGLLIKFHKMENPMLWSSLIFNYIDRMARKNELISAEKTKTSCNSNLRSCMIQVPKIEVNNNIQLSDREQKVLFLLSLNYNTRQIADILTKIEKKNITPNLIRNNINQQLYIKFEVNNVTDLIEKYSMLNDDKLIPACFNKPFAATVKCAIPSF